MAAKKAMEIEGPMDGRGHRVPRGPGRQSQKASKKYDAALLAVESADTPKKVASVIRMLEGALKEGDFRAAYALGTWYFHGKFLEKDQKRGFMLMLEAANEFVPDACFDVAVAYEMGAGVRKSLQKAAIYYFRAMMLGDNQAISEVGRLFYWGIGFPKHRGIAKELLNFATPDS